MAKHKARKKQKQKLPKPPQPTQTGLSTRLRSMFGKIVIFLSLIAVIIALCQAWPSLSVGEGERIDVRNPYSTKFSIANQGYLPVTDLDVMCRMNFSIGRGTANDNVFGFNEFAHILNHSKSATLPCFRAIGLSPEVGAPFSTVGDLTATVSYSLWPLKIRWMRQTQEFRFKAFQAPDGNFIWTFVN